MLLVRSPAPVDAQGTKRKIDAATHVFSSTESDTEPDDDDFGHLYGDDVLLSSTESQFMSATPDSLPFRPAQPTALAITNHHQHDHHDHHHHHRHSKSPKIAKKLCRSCGGLGKTRRCSGMCGGTARYCSVECQRSDWRKLHRYECSNV